MKQFIENHPAIVLLVVCAACVSAAYGVLSYFHNKEITYINHKHEERATELTDQIASIDRGILVDGPRRFSRWSS